MNNSNEKYYAIKSLHMAMAIGFITGRKYMVFNDYSNSNKKIYSFVNDEVFQKAMKVLNEARKELHE